LHFQTRSFSINFFYAFFFGHFSFFSVFFFRRWFLIRRKCAKSRAGILLFPSAFWGVPELLLLWGRGGLCVFNSFSLFQIKLLLWIKYVHLKSSASLEFRTSGPSKLKISNQENCNCHWSHDRQLNQGGWGASDSLCFVEQNTQKLKSFLPLPFFSFLILVLAKVAWLASCAV
jgi:hypothetical protein